ncbi:MAG TPA: hypothetical protein VNC61_07660 [Acidimicrobiales bacterium]|nr:hypothetical protein [Acidimicrobiales bacterium]
MPDDRTTVTELATALGMFPYPDVRAALAARPGALTVSEATWSRLSELYTSGRLAEEFGSAFANGRAFLEAPDALDGRKPRLVEWTGGRRPPGDEVAPVDLRIDHVYLVSCKYLSRNIANPSPARLFEGLLATTGDWEQTDWYRRTAGDEYRALYEACRKATGLDDLPDDPGSMTAVERRRLRVALPGRSYPAEAQDLYGALCRRVSDESAERWAANVVRQRAQERQAWRLLRIGNATYFLLGADAKRPLRLRVASPWDWRQAYEFLDLEIRPARAGQPQVDWSVIYRERATGRRRVVEGHVEVRWSHGRFAQPPEAKVYLDTPTDEVPGYFALDEAPDQRQLWDR